MEPTSTNFRAGYVALIGEPNVGKSTLLNTLLKQKISIVTNKPQTTRHKILGIHNGNNYQIVFLDTPGIIKPKYLLQEVMMHFASQAVEDADVVMLLVDAEKVKSGSYDKNNEAVEKIKAANKTTFLIVNKIDLLKKEEILPLLADLQSLFPFDEIIPLSALTKFNTNELLTTLVKYLPENPPYYDTEIVSDAQERFFVSEMIREKIFELYEQEIPYSTTVDIIEFKERELGKHYISADIVIERNSQKGILIGKEGKALKRLGTLSRKSIEEFLGHTVYLELHVKVRSDWREDKNWLDRFGYKEE
ncbi:MAG: GTPase Era [Bacteriovoracaceae bacterium]|nr:GTPase Era [Bacteroidota bacterium]